MWHYTVFGLLKSSGIWKVKIIKTCLRDKLSPSSAWGRNLHIWAHYMKLISSSWTTYVTWINTTSTPSIHPPICIYKNLLYMATKENTTLPNKLHVFKINATKTLQWPYLLNWWMNSTLATEWKTSVKDYEKHKSWTFACKRQIQSLKISTYTNV